MKKIILFVVIMLIITATSFAQTEKGNWLMGGSGEFSSQKTGDFKTTSFSFEPAAGYFIAKDFALGAGLGFTSSKDEGDADAVSAFSFAPFVRYYFLPLGTGAKLFGDASFGVGSVKYTDSQSFTQWGIDAGPAIFLNPHTALEITLGYGSMKIKDATDATNAFRIRIGFQVHLGATKKAD